MARYIGPKCRNCRRFGMKLCSKPATKCAWERRKSPPGVQSTRRRRTTEYGIQLREKQKARAIYGILERQFRNYYMKANKLDGVTGDLLLQFLESRLDNVVYRIGFADSRDQARQFVNHGHILVNGSRVDIPSFQVSESDTIEWKKNPKDTPFIQEITKGIPKRPVPDWLSLSTDDLKGKVNQLPIVSDVDTGIDSRLIVEFYSR